ncbi:NAD(P)/FAD-dependent oxidoreductase [Piscinibacter koreensis]|uniref:NAD(P)/FAD-dependent oxidoreductase n=1 Tax=Piscinibacter koreensis TaxID=2742824 RepID=UPI001FECB9D9|nr:hypothetical protein [Schlegelella koreensis]
MLRLTDLRLPLDHPADALPAAIAARLGVETAALVRVDVVKRSYDVRNKRAPVFIYTIDVAVDGLAAGEPGRGAGGDAGSAAAPADPRAVMASAADVTLLARLAGDPHVRPAPDMRYRFVGHVPADFGTGATPRPLVVGFGPCGIFAALLLAQMGLKPIVLERGKAVRERTKDTWRLWRKGVLTPESNVQFGEGGAGTFSDGKLWSQISDPRHLMRKVLDEFVKAGAPDEILYVGKPHIGTFRLVGVVEKMRAEIVRLGGEIRFGQRVVDVLIEGGRMRGVVVEAPAQPAALPNGPNDRLAGNDTDVVPAPEDRADAGPTNGPTVSASALTAPAAAAGRVRLTLAADHVVLAPGHSARDTFEMLHARGVHIDAKPFSIGFRIEHPQSLIDRARFGPSAGHPLLGAADYKLVHHAKNGRSVYSFCMCPGGTVVAATSEPDRVVTNGMSQYSRNERNANAGIVVALSPADCVVPGADPSTAASPLAGIAFQRFWESRAFELGGGGYVAPGQRVGDFLARRASTALGSVEPSYQPGVRPTSLDTALPRYAIDAIREALPAFERPIKGFALADAVLTGVETRTSSPIRITRDATTRQSLNVIGLYPAGEGAGYAGGIMSAAVDGIETAEAVARAILATTLGA